MIESKKKLLCCVLMSVLLMGMVFASSPQMLTVLADGISDGQSDGNSGGGNGGGGNNGGNYSSSSTSSTALTISGLPQKVYVGTKFTLTPSRDGRTGSAGWTWDENFFDATFNSPATFTALKAGTTIIKFTDSSGWTATVNVEVLAAGTQQDNPNTGSGGLLYLLPVCATAAAVFAFPLRKSRKE